MPYIPDTSFFEEIPTVKPAFLRGWESLPVEAQTERNARVMKRAMVRLGPDTFLAWIADPVLVDWRLLEPR